MRSMNRWIRRYDNSKHREPNESWANSRYGPLNMSWQEAQQIWLPSINQRLGPAFFYLKKLWAKYKRLGREGDYRSDVAFQIVASNNMTHIVYIAL
jgi:hypothetical protein